MRIFIILTLLLSTFSVVQAQEIEFSRAELQQTLESYMPHTQQQSIVQLTLDKPRLQLLADEQRVQIKCLVQVTSIIGGQGQGWVTFNGKLRYQNTDHSFYIDDLRIIDLEIEGMPQEFKGQVIRLTQDIAAPLLAEQPVYTLKSDNIQESLAKMMLRSITIKENAVVASLSLF